MTPRRFLATALVTSLGALVATGCAEERPPIDRVQADALEKSFFVGDDLVGTQDDPEFYAQGTLVDVGYGASQDGLFTSTYAQPLTRLKWVITEDYLIGRITYERIDNSDGKGAGPASTDGVVAATYRIKSHFDITKAYNSTTGEELNILEENTRDRPWNQREYFRVDWSKNLATESYDYDTLSLLGIYGGITYEPIAYYVNDPADEDAPHFDLDNGYFDVTFKAFAKPGEIDLSHFGWGIDKFPACFLEADFLSGSWPAGSCNPIELTIRQSFRKVEDTDYEPVHWDGYRFQAYGAFYVERFGFDRNYGMLDSEWRRFPARYNIWERSHFYADPDNMLGEVACYTPDTTPFGEDPGRDLDGDGTDDECAIVGNGSKCDSFKQRCTLPYRERTPKAIAWYYTEKSDPRFFDPTEWATHEWDVAMRASVRTAQYAECNKVGDTDCAAKWPMWFGQQDDNEDAVTLAREVDDCRNGRAYPERNRDRASCDALADELGAARGYSAGVIDVAKMDEMIVLCHSPVEAGDPAACGTQRLPEGVTAEMCAEATAEDLVATCDSALRVRRGDLRYHQVNVITEPQTPSPWGIYTDAEDPLTGETISASINVWSYINDLWSQSIVDVTRYINGELDDADITEGKNIRDFASAAKAAESTGALPKMSRDERDSRLAAFVKADVERVREPKMALDSPPMKQARAVKRQLRNVAAKLGAASSNAPMYAARRAQAVGTPVEASLMNSMMQQLYGVGGLPLSNQVMNLTSPLRGGNPSIQRDLYNFKQQALAERGACIMHEAPAPLGLASLGDVLQAKFGAFNPADPPDVQQARAERMRMMIAERAHYSVIAHEMGHSVGARHNFVSSADAWAYRPQYWQLRTRNGAVTQECTELGRDGKDCVGPRYFDPMTDEEESNLQWMFMQSSIMDYAGEATQDMIGLGAWDFAAPRMFYGDVVAVHADGTYGAQTPRGSGMLSIMDSFGGIAGLEFEIGGEPIHYSQLDREFKLISDCQAVDPMQFKPANWDEQRHGAWHPVFDGRIVQVDGEYTKCKQQQVDYVFWDDQRFPTEAEAGQYYYGGPAIDPDNRVRVPYGFATDGWADLGNLSVYRHDNGADPYELFNFLITQQETYHIFTNYRRGFQSFSVRRAANRSLHRYNEKLRDAAKGLGLFANIYRLVALDEGYDFDTFWPDVAPYWFKEQILASGLGFDHFARQAARPAAGNHYLPAVGGDTVLRSDQDAWGTPTATLARIPNGATGYFGNVEAGGRPVENKLADNQGEYDSEFTINAGSYYEKIWTAMLFTESVDNFISSSRSDFYDARYRSVSMADLFPDGYRRWLGNNLTGDDEIKGMHLAADGMGVPVVDDEGWPALPAGYTQWWTEDVKTCFPAAKSTVCSYYGAIDSEPLDERLPSEVVPIDPQLGWEQQKFLIAWTLVYLPENQQQWWLDQMRLFELGMDNDPGYDNRIEFHNPTGQTFVAKTFGKETIFGKTVHKGIAARVLQYANQLLAEAYVTDPGPDLDGDSEPDWYLPRLNPDTGQPLVRWDPSIEHVEDGFLVSGVPGCNDSANYACTCSSNRACVKLSEYVTVPTFLRQALADFGYYGLSQKGIYD